MFAECDLERARSKDAMRAARGLQRVAQLVEPRTQRELRRESANATALPTPEMGTVGAVALDRAGDLAAATSTGGRTNKRFGRIGDVPVIGAGTYADNRTCAVSATGKVRSRSGRRTSTCSEKPRVGAFA